ACGGATSLGVGGLTMELNAATKRGSVIAVVGAASLAISAVAFATSGGGGWSIQPTPSPTGSLASYLRGIACSSSSACTTVGEFETKRGKHLTLVERWNGNKWSLE